MFKSPGSTQHIEAFPLSGEALLDIKSMGLELPENLLTATSLRQQEFLAGRYCALRALKSAGYYGPARIRKDSDGAPVWPHGWVGSITHSKGLAAAAIGRSEVLRGLGIDTELVMTDQKMKSVIHRILTENEIRKWQDPQRVTLIFSAKEAIYKCLRPLSRKYFGFEDAEIRMIGDDSFEYELLRDIGGPCQKGMTSTGTFSISGQRIYTAVELRVKD